MLFLRRSHEIDELYRKAEEDKPKIDETNVLTVDVAKSEDTLAGDSKTNDRPRSVDDVCEDETADSQYQVTDDTSNIDNSNPEGQSNGFSSVDQVNNPDDKTSSTNPDGLLIRSDTGATPTGNADVNDAERSDSTDDSKADAAMLDDLSSFSKHIAEMLQYDNDDDIPIDVDDIDGDSDDDRNLPLLKENPGLYSIPE